ncbi:CLUMA_CG009860, isoform A [Clunio marinus]|uniref:CLUMA_CG009860, isoform A n=1 Tax=Clunio marinus TaxID=568069 RepID=A0A1J1IDH1_9DIPT|nr:CLUMA_CG009860, isoform A [Clunio marinus]
MSKCIQNFWPPKLDMTKDECRGVLRRLELDAYSSVVSTFRAQGSLDNSKQNVLDQLRRCFHISEDRHKAEVRRVANSEKLTTISELLNGKSYDLEWIREGHRNYPLIGRAPPYSALHILADHASKAAAIENSQLPHPSDTKRSRIVDGEADGKSVVTEDPTLPPPSPAIFGINRKDLKKSFDISVLHQSSRKKHYQHLKPPPPPNVKIQHLYQTLNAKRPRKSLTKKSPKVRATKQSPGRMHLPYPPDEKHFDGAELQRHLTSQLMPPPMSPMKSPYAPILPAGNKKDMNLIKMNHQSMEPQAHYIPNNPTRLKNELLGGETTKGRTGRSKSVHVQSRSNYQTKYANGSGARNMDHIPDPQIIFNTTSSKVEQNLDAIHQHMEHNNHDMDLSTQAMASPLQLLSTAASCTPKLKVTTPLHHHHQQPQQQPTTSQPTPPQIPSQNSIKTVPNRAIKIIPTNTKPVIIKPAETTIKPSSQQSIITSQPSKFKIQKIQLVMNKSQDGTPTTASLSPSATIVSGKAGQLVLSGKGITNSYQLGGKSPYTIVSHNPKGPPGSKVIVQTIDRNFTLKDSSPESPIPENQRITENTPIDFLPSTTGTTNFPKVIIHKSPTSSTSTTTKQIKLKLGTSIVNPKIIKGPIPANLKIQRNINTKGFTVVNSSQFLQLQTSSTATTPVTPTTSGEGSKVDWEQELDDANRTKGGKSTTKSNGAGSLAKKIRLDEKEANEGNKNEASESDNNNMIVETVDIVDPSSNVVVFENQQQIDVVAPESTQTTNITDIVSEYVFLNHEEDATATASTTATNTKPVEESSPVSTSTINGDGGAEVNGQVNQERPPQNGAEAYENLVKSLTECDNDYMKDMVDDSEMNENFGLIDGNILENFSFNRESGLFQ